MPCTVTCAAPAAGCRAGGAAPTPRAAPPPPPPPPRAAGPLALAAAALLLAAPLAAAPPRAAAAEPRRGGVEIVAVGPKVKDALAARDEAMAFKCKGGMFDCDADRSEYARRQWADFQAGKTVARRAPRAAQ